MPFLSDLDHCRLDATLSNDGERVLHFECISDASRGLRNHRVERIWHRQRNLGRGHYGEVWLEERADDPRVQRAVKTILKSRMVEINIDHTRELKALAEFSKAKHREKGLFVDFLGWWDEKSNDTVSFAMEYFPLGDLESNMKTVSGEGAIREIAAQLLQGLTAMHAEGFAHRDLKPANILVVQTAPTWWVKIGDFGMSKRIESGDTALRTLIGTPDYMAPEIFGIIDCIDEEHSDYTHAIDIWALGCIVYRLCAHTVPFPSYPNLSPLRRFCHKITSFPQEDLLSRGVSARVIAFTEALLKPEPSERLTAQAAFILVESLKDCTSRTASSARLLLTDVPNRLMECTVNTSHITSKLTRLPSASITAGPPNPSLRASLLPDQDCGNLVDASNLKLETRRALGDDEQFSQHESPQTRGQLDDCLDSWHHEGCPRSPTMNHRPPPKESITGHESSSPLQLLETSVHHKDVIRARMKNWAIPKPYSYDGDDTGAINDDDDSGGYEQSPPARGPPELAQRGQSAIQQPQEAYGGLVDTCSHEATSITILSDKLADLDSKITAIAPVVAPEVAPDDVDKCFRKDSRLGTQTGNVEKPTEAVKYRNNSEKASSCSEPDMWMTFPTAPDGNSRTRANVPFHPEEQSLARQPLDEDADMHEPKIAEGIDKLRKRRRIAVYDPRNGIQVASTSKRSKQASKESTGVYCPPWPITYMLVAGEVEASTAHNERVSVLENSKATPPVGVAHGSETELLILCTQQDKAFSRKEKRRAERRLRSATCLSTTAEHDSTDGTLNRGLESFESDDDVRGCSSKELETRKLSAPGLHKGHKNEAWWERDHKRFQEVQGIRPLQDSPPVICSIPEDGSPITVPVDRSKQSIESQTSLLIEYFEGGPTTSWPPRVAVGLESTAPAACTTKDTAEHSQSIGIFEATRAKAVQQKAENFVKEVSNPDRLPNKRGPLQAVSKSTSFRDLDIHLSPIAGAPNSTGLSAQADASTSSLHKQMPLSTVKESLQLLSNTKTSSNNVPARSLAPRYALGTSSPMSIDKRTTIMSKQVAQKVENMEPIYSKGIFSASIRTSKPLSIIRMQITQALKSLNIKYQDIRGGFECRSVHAIVFQIVIVKVPLVFLHGIQFKRLIGIQIFYKKIVRQMLDKLRL